MEGEFLRFVNGGPLDWRTHAMVHGQHARPESVPVCSWNALSVFGAMRDAANMRRRIKKFRNHTLLRFAIDPSMGNLHRDKPYPDTHHNWWPSDSFVPPPGITESVEFGDE